MWLLLIRSEKKNAFFVLVKEVETNTEKQGYTNIEG